MATVEISVRDDNSKFRSNWIKIHLLRDQATHLLQQRFNERWTQYNGMDWDEDPSGSAAKFIGGCGQKLYKLQGNIQKEFIQTKPVQDWDMALLLDILTQIDFGQGVDKQERKQIDILRQVRNQTAHTPRAGISDHEFEMLWGKAAPVVVYFGGVEADLIKLKQSTNLADFENQYTSTIHFRNTGRAAELKGEGNDLFTNREFQKAIDIYTQAIGLEGLSEVDRGTLYSNRSAAYLSLVDHKWSCNDSSGGGGASPEAMKHYALADAKEAMRLRPAWYKAYFRAGSAYHSVCKYDKAVRTFDWALSLAPGKLEIQNARDESQRKLCADVRLAHLDTRLDRFSPEYAKKRMEKIFGMPVSDRMYAEHVKLEESRIPGQAVVNQGHACYYGRCGVRQDFEAAVHFYSKAVTAGNAEGIYFLSRMYKCGHGVKQDLKMSIKLFKEAASKPPFWDVPKKEPVRGVAEAECALGIAHYDGVGVPQDFQLAFGWFKKAHRHGVVEGTHGVGTMYFHGKGVAVDKKRAGQYWHMAASQQHTESMHSLAHYYLSELDPVQAKHWYDLAITHGSVTAKLNKEEFDNEVSNLRAHIKEEDKLIAEWESQEGMQTDGLTRADRVRRAQLGMNSTEGQQLIDEMERLHALDLHTPPMLKNADVTTMSKLANDGSISARIFLEALQHFYDATKLFFNGLNAQTRPAFYQELAESCRTDLNVIQGNADMTRQMRWRASAKKFLESLPPDESSDLDRNVRVCFVSLNLHSHSSQELLRFVEASTKKYPEEKLFHELTAYQYFLLTDYKNAMKVVQQGLQRFPGDVQLMFTNAMVNTGYTQMQDPKIQRPEAILAWEQFLSVAPKDHCHVPQALYTIGILQHQMGDDEECPDTWKAGMGLVNKYYQLGLEAEKIQLPCNLPYPCNEKPILENYLRMYEEAKIKNLPKLPPPKSDLPVADGSAKMALLTSPLRANVIIDHRQFVKEYTLNPEKPHTTGWRRLHVVNNPKHKQAAPKRLTGLKPITFKKMNLFEDQVYEDFVLAVRSVEDPSALHVPSVRLVLEDENQDVGHAFIYNFDAKNYKELVQSLGHGATLSILNPCMRLAENGVRGICVDDPSTLFLHSESAPRSCRFCGKEAAPLRCTKCKKAFYCGPECQKVDWKTLKHKLICIP